MAILSSVGEKPFEHIPILQLGGFVSCAAPDLQKEITEQHHPSFDVMFRHRRAIGSLKEKLHQIIERFDDGIAELIFELQSAICARDVFVSASQWLSEPERAAAW